MEKTPIRPRAIITGASSGIGKATAIAFASSGIDLCLIGRSEDKLSEVAAQVAEYGGQVKTVATDLSQVAQVRSLFASLAEQFGPIDILVNSAGIGYTNLLQDTPLEDWEKVIRINLTSIFQAVVGLLPSMRQRGRGTIINVASVAGLQPFPGWGAYCVSKAALVAFGQCLAQEERRHGIRVTTICPGAVDTPIWDTETVQVKLPREAMLKPETVAQTILHVALLPQEAVIEQLVLTPSLGVL